DLGDVVGIENAVPLLEAVSLREILADPGGVDGTIDYRMRHMNALRAQLTCHALSQATQGELGAGECRKAGPAAYGGRSAGENDRAAPTRQHDPRSLASGQEAGVSRHLPDLAKNALGGLRDREAHIGADVEDHCLQRTD